MDPLHGMAGVPIEFHEQLPPAYAYVEEDGRGPLIPLQPRVVFIEVTNHCNLLCETCPRTFATYETPKTLPWDDFRQIVDQFPAMERAVLHGIGEPLLNKELPRMIATLKARDIEVLFNTNATLLTDDWATKLIEAGLDQLRVSIDGADPKTYALIRGAPLLHKVVANLRRFIELQHERRVEKPHVSLWMTGMKENIRELPAVIRLASQIGVSEIYLQRLVYYADEPAAPGMMQHEHSLFREADDEVERIISETEAVAGTLGVRLQASGATTPRHSLSGMGAIQPLDAGRPWTACMRPWTTAYITANGNALPCCISPFATTDYDSLKLGNVLEQPFDELWNAERYQAWRERLLSEHPHPTCSNCGVHWSL